MYNSGLRVYLLDNYNWMDFTLLSLYLASYALRFLVDHWIKVRRERFSFGGRGSVKLCLTQSQGLRLTFTLLLVQETDKRFYATTRARGALMSQNYSLFEEIEEELRYIPAAYFTKACKCWV